MKRRRRNRWVLPSGLALLLGCAGGPGEQLDGRRRHLETEIQALGLADDPAVDAQRAAVEAAIAREDDSPVLDGIEVRTAAVHEVDSKAQMLVRLPVEDLLGAPALREARRAETDVELARLEEVTLQQRVRLCVPSLDQLVYVEHMRIYASYEERQRALLQRIEELYRAGRVDEIGAARFQLAGHVSLARREPPPPPQDPALASRERLLAVLPQPETQKHELDDAPAIVREQLLRHHPVVDVHRARGRGFEAMARREKANRYPTLGFIDVGFEPVAYPGDERQYGARVAVEIPFGRGARASERRYHALARGQRSAERAWVEESVRQTRAAVEEINRFRRLSERWLGLLERADAAERVADRWWRGRLADPTVITRLLDDVYDARIAVLEAQERAGYASCAVLASTGTTVDDWPR